MLTLRILTQELPNEWMSYKKNIIEELIDISPEEALKYIEQEVLDVPEKKYASIEEYWNECWKPHSYSNCFYGKDDPWIATMFKNLSEAYEFWVEEKTGESLRKWLKELKSPLFSIIFKNTQIDLFNNDIPSENVETNG